MESSLNSAYITGIQGKIRDLLDKKNAILLVHNYQRPEVQDIADFCGDSLELSIKASQTDAEVIVFCGVHFMAETASILCPDKKVLLPVLGAGCPMADMITAQALKEKKQEMPDAIVISYVNTTAEVKAESDLCCTSANAIQVVNSVEPGTHILMTPDKNLARYSKKHTDRDISYWEGYCPIHNLLTVGQVRKVKAAHPKAVFLAHPECPPDVLDLADVVRSTSGIIAYAASSSEKEFIIGTETGILHPLSKANPDKIFIPADPNMVCTDMKKTGLADIIRALTNLEPEVNVPEKTRFKAKEAVDRMLAISVAGTTDNTIEPANEPPKKIKASLEYLKKLFIMPDSPDKFMEFGHEVLEMIHEFFQERGGIHSSITLPELSRIFEQTSMPGGPNLIKDVLAEIKTKVVGHSVKVGSPYYIGHMISAVPYFMILLEMITAALNQNQVKIETAKASSFVERELIAWLHRLVFNKTDKFYKKNIQNPRVALGNVTSDGTLANMSALLVAREKAFPPREDFPGLRMAGMESALRYYGYSRGVIIVSKRGHYSITKTANLLGIGEQNVLKIPVDNDNRIDLKRLRRRVNSLKKGKDGKETKIIAIVGIAGTTETGNIDNLEELSGISREVGAHFHVDACWGGSALLVDEYRHLFKGIENADSVSVDAHKLLYCPTAMGLVLFRDERDLNFIRHSSQYVIRKNSVDSGRFTIEGSRPFACLKPWASLKIIGRQGYGLLFRHAHESTNTLKEILDDSCNFETLNTPELFILNYRFIPGNIREQLLAPENILSGSKGKPEEAEQKITKINHLINGLNIKLHKALRRDDTTFVSRTILESTRYRPQNIVVLRAVLINPLTDKQVLKNVVCTQNRLGLQIWKEFEPVYKRIIKDTEKGG